VSTKIIFAGCLRKYCEFRGMTPEELVDEGEADLRRGKKGKVVKQHLIEFKAHLKEGRRGASTVTTHMTAIRLFFNSHDVPLPKLSNGNIEAVDLSHDFDREKVRELVNACNPRDRAIFLTMFQSGLAANAIANLRIKDLKEVTEEGITILKLRREKNNGHGFTTFLGRDARRAIDEYLRIRNEGTLLRTRPHVSKDATVKGDDDYVFVNYDHNHNQWNKFIPSKISVYMRQVCEKLGWLMKNLIPRPETYV
jgi:integrase